MRRFDVISLDMFQTLVDLDTSAHSFWRKILGDELTEVEAVQHDREMLDIFFEVWKAEKEGPMFRLMREIYEQTFQAFYAKKGYTLDHQGTTDILIEELRNATLYQDTLPFLREVTAKYQVCIVSDADDLMLPDFHEAFPIQVLTSEQHRSYKNDAHNVMLQRVIEMCHADPERIIHIGDSVSDVLGAKRCGITACWLNRNGRTWTGDVKPDYTASSLSEVLYILESTDAK